MGSNGQKYSVEHSERPNQRGDLPRDLSKNRFKINERKLKEGYHIIRRLAIVFEYEGVGCG